METSPPVIWTLLAACAGMDTDLWFPSMGGRDPYREARRVCNGCPVRRACLEYALDVESDTRWLRQGMFGGATARERNEMHWLWEIKGAA